MDKKARELAALREVYPEAEFPVVTPREKPDFSIGAKDGGLPFGVEVTEFYFSESTARLRNIPYYLKRLIEGDRAHKADLTELPISTVRIISPEGADKGEFRGVIKETPSFAKYSAALADVVRRKAEILPGYAADMRHVNLLIVDQEKRVRSTPENQVIARLLSHDLTMAAAASGFREVLISTVHGQDQVVVIPVLTTSLYVEATTAIAALVEFGLGELVDDPDDALSTLCAVMQRTQIPFTLVRGPDGMLEIALGPAGYAVRPDWSPVIRDYADYGVVREPVERRPIPLPEGFTSYFNEFRAKHMFVGGILRMGHPSEPVDADGHPKGGPDSR
jgi:hypothetical protein